MSETVGAKMVNTILFFLEKVNDNTLGATKLAKLLFFTDLESYKKYGRTITDQDYIRMPRGPMPVEFPVKLNALRKEGIIKKGKRGTHYLPAKTYNASLFTSEELELLTGIASKYFSHLTEILVELSHKDYAWKHLKHGSYISFELASVESKEEVIELISIASQLTPTAIVQESKELLVSLERGKEDAKKGKFYPVDSLFG